MRTLFLALLLTATSSGQDGTVIVYRVGKFVGSGLKPSIYVDGNQLARLGNGRYVSLHLAPGKHQFDSSMKKEPPVEVEVKSNETLYLEMVILTGTWRGGGRLIPVAPEDGKNALVKLKPMDGTQADMAETSTPQSESPQAEPPTNNSPAEQMASVTIKSTPSGADINVDGKFVGNTPSTLQLTVGDHFISIEKEGLRPWQRNLTVSPRGNVTIDATLEKP
jgi:hypothetical protein